MKRVVLFDPAVGSLNLGDYVIVEAVEREIRAALNGCHIVHVSIHQGLRSPQRSALANADHIFVGGSNMMNLRMWPLRGESRWKVSFEDYKWIDRATLFGVGWAGYKHKPNWFGVEFYKRILHMNTLHSVRDEYTRQRLLHEGFNGIINTACPTMWGLTPDFMSGIPYSKSDSVIFTLTDTSPSPTLDTAMVNGLLRSYKKVYFWPQGVGDFAYFKRLAIDNVEVVGSSLREYDAVLSSDIQLDYCGTRLHGGIRALQHGRRSLIVAIDNRAKELSETTGLPIIDRNECKNMEDLVSIDVQAELGLPWENISKFRAQLREGL